MKPTKIEITPEVREFNEMVELADCLTDYKHDREPARILVSRLQDEGCYPYCVAALKNAIAGMAIKSNIERTPEDRARFHADMARIAKTIKQ